MARLCHLILTIKRRADNAYLMSTGSGSVDRPYPCEWLISIDHQPDHGYYTFQNLVHQLEGVQCVERYQGVPDDVEAYHFEATGRTLYVIWSNTFTYEVTLPASAEAILTDRDGNSLGVIPAQNGYVTFEVGPTAVFVEIIR